MMTYGLIERAGLSLIAIVLMSSCPASASDRMIDAWTGVPLARYAQAQPPAQDAPPTANTAPAAPAPPAPAAPASPPAQAAPAAKAPPPSAAEGTPAMVVDGQQLESILGRKVKSDNGDDMGRIVDILADKTGQVRAAIIDFGGFLGVGSRQIAVDWKAIRFSTEAAKSDSVIALLTRDQLRVAPVYKPGEQIVVLGQSTGTPRPAAAAAPATPAAATATPDAPAPAADAKAPAAPGSSAKDPAAK